MNVPLKPRAVLDACVLYPAPLRDLFMHLSVVGAFQARWSEEIHQEWIRNVLANRPDLTEKQLNRTRALMDANAEGSLVEGYEHRIPTLILPDANDRHVLAAAIESEAPIIVTENRRDFPARALSPFGIIALRSDDFLCALYDNAPALICEAVRNQRLALRNPPRTLDEHVATLTQNGLKKFVVRLRPHAADL